MEGSAKPVNFERTFMHSLTTTWDNTERGLLPDEIQTIVAETLDAERAKLKRFGDDGQELPLRDTSDSGVDQLESARNFLDTVQVFLNTKVNQLVSTLERFKDS